MDSFGKCREVVGLAAGKVNALADVAVAVGGVQDAINARTHGYLRKSLILVNWD